MIVVSDTSPLNYLILVGCVDVLPVMFRSVIAPSAVIRELKHPRASEAVRSWASAPPGWLTIRRPMSGEPIGRLDSGESEAIALAEEMRGTNASLRLLIDERDGSRVARSRGFLVIGTLAVLEEAAHRRLIHLPATVARLRETSFHVDDAMLSDMLRRASRDGDPA